MSARLRTVHPSDQPPHDTFPAFTALVCDGCDRPIVVQDRFEDFMLRHWVIGATVSTLQRLADTHDCPVVG